MFGNGTNVGQKDVGLVKNLQAYMHARATAGWSGRRAAWIAVAGFTLFWFNFVGINLLVAGLHSYAGI